MDIVSLLYAEKERLNTIVEKYWSELTAAKQPAIVQMEKKSSLTGENISVDYISMDKFTPEQREKYDYLEKKYHAAKAKLDVFNNLIKKLSSQEVVQDIESRYKDISTSIESPEKISCDFIDLGVNGEPNKHWMNVSQQLFECPREMSFEEYQEIYTSSMNNLLARSLGNSVTQEQAMQKIQDACSEVYLSKYNLGTEKSM
jgi:hypothetical protein